MTSSRTGSASGRSGCATPALNQFVVLAEEDDDLIGFACAYGRHDETWGSLLDNIHVRPEYQRRGFGAGLVAEVAAWCRANYADCGLYLWVLEQNHPAQRFYQRLGASDQGGEISEPLRRRADPRAPLRVEGRPEPPAVVSESVRRRCVPSLDAAARQAKSPRGCITTASPLNLAPILWRTSE